MKKEGDVLDSFAGPVNELWRSPFFLLFFLFYFIPVGMQGLRLVSR
jgi:hypothetical protein